MTSRKRSNKSIELQEEEEVRHFDEYRPKLGNDPSFTSVTTCFETNEHERSQCAQKHLAKEHVLEIFATRPKEADHEKLRRGTLLSCKEIAAKYGVTPKSVRDIWRGRSWSDVTGQLRSDRDAKASKIKVGVAEDHSGSETSEPNFPSPLGSSHLMRDCPAHAPEWTNRRVREKSGHLKVTSQRTRQSVDESDSPDSIPVQGMLDAPAIAETLPAPASPNADTFLREEKFDLPGTQGHYPAQQHGMTSQKHGEGGSDEPNVPEASVFGASIPFRAEDVIILEVAGAANPRFNGKYLELEKPVNETAAFAKDGQDEAVWYFPDRWIVGPFENIGGPDGSCVTYSCLPQAFTGEAVWLEAGRQNTHMTVRAVDNASRLWFRLNEKRLPAR